MFTKTIFPTTTFHFLENRPAPMLGNISHGGAKRVSDRPWFAMGMVLCAHLAAFTALLPHSRPLPLEPVAEPIMVSLLSAPQKSTPPAAHIEKIQKKPVKTPVSKPAVSAIKQNLPVSPPVEQASMPVTPTSSPAAEPVTKPTNNKVADMQIFQSPSFNAAYLNNPAPTYPSISRRLGEQGLVSLRVQVTVDGAAGSVELQTSSGSSRLDQAALEAVKKWQFVPAKRGDQPVSASVVVPVRFSIEG